VVAAEELVGGSELWKKLPYLVGHSVQLKKKANVVLKIV